MKQSQLGVLREDPQDDMRLLLENYTAAALASALREREDTLQHCANLLAQLDLPSKSVPPQLEELSKISSWFLQIRSKRYQRTQKQNQP